MNIVFFGSGSHILPILEKIIDNFKLSLIVTTEKDINKSVVAFATKNKISYLSVSVLDDKSKNEIERHKAPIAVVASFGLIISNDLLSSFKYGMLNIHPSLLPKYRGATPVQSAILNGDKTTGVSVMKLDDKMDHGPLLAKDEVEIEKNETADRLYLRLFKIGAKLLSENAKKYAEGALKPVAQDDTKATYIEPLNRDSGYFDLKAPPNKDLLERMIRAYYPWPGVWTKAMINNKETRIKFLPENKLQVEGKKPINFKDFKNGYPEIYNMIAGLL
jgi:methionyl-tRNA formyltransferase